MTKPCKRGHTSGRYASGNCIECSKAKASSWYKDNIDRARTYRASHYQRNRSAAIERAIAWNRGNCERRREIVSRWHKDNADKIKAYVDKNIASIVANRRAYHIKNKEKLNAYLRSWKKINRLAVNAMNSSRMAKVRGAEGRFTRSDIDLMLIEQLGRCALCSVQMMDYHIDHIMPVSLGGSNWPSNLQLLCPPCNLSKGARVL